MKLSLIIPIYNAESFLPRLFENLEAQGVFQDNKDVGEVLFVIDGSPDNSEEIIYEYSKKHTWVRIFRQENQGQHIARNTGIKEAKGEYIAFMDQDDAYAKNALKLLIDVSSYKNAEIIYGKVSHSSDENFKIWKDYDYKSILVSKSFSGIDRIISTNGFEFTQRVWGGNFSSKIFDR